MVSCECPGCRGNYFPRLCQHFDPELGSLYRPRGGTEGVRFKKMKECLNQETEMQTEKPIRGERKFFLIVITKFILDHLLLFTK